MKHTPGPWEVDKETGEITANLSVLGIIYGADDFPCCEEDIDEEYKANARLIAAAPDLLEACNEIYNSWHYFQCPICDADDEECKPDCAWPKMVRAILKAEAKE